MRSSFKEVVPLLVECYDQALPRLKVKDGTLKGASRRYVMSAVEASLTRLKTDWIDLYQVHQPDPLTPIEETLRALDDLVRHGKVRYIGCSNFPAWQVVAALFSFCVCALAVLETHLPNALRALPYARVKVLAPSRVRSVLQVREGFVRASCSAFEDACVFAETHLLNASLPFLPVP